MDKIKIKVDFDTNKLEELGYKFVPIEAGYISHDGSTIITTERLGHKREVMQYRKNAINEHLENVNQLKRIDAIE